MNRIKHDRVLIVLNTLFMIKEYGWKLLLRHRRRWNCFFTTTYIFKYVKRMMADILHRGDYVFSFQMQSLFDASADGISHFIYTDHTYLANLNYTHYDIRELPTKKWLALEKTAYENATLTFVRSTHVQQSIVDQYGCQPDPVKCVYAGTNADIDCVEATQASRDKNILFVGIDWKRKGGPELVEAFKRVLAVHPDAQLTIVGCRPECDVPQCEVVGKVPCPEVGRYFETATLFCLPTKVEPFGIVFVEALHYGLPIVATHIGAIPDMVVPGRNGFLVPPGDSEHLSEALIQLLGSPELRHRFGEQSRKLASEQYNWQNVGSRFRTHINERLDDVN